jgi:hypothetical protein
MSKKKNKIEFFYAGDVTYDDIENMHGKCINFVCILSVNSSIKFWKGELDNEYFTITYTGGLLFVSVAERETYIDRNRKYIGHIAQLQQFKNKISDDKSLSFTDSFKELMKEFTTVDKINDIPFESILDFLGWTMKSGIEVEEFLT